MRHESRTFVVLRPSLLSAAIAALLVATEASGFMLSPVAVGYTDGSRTSTDVFLAATATNSFNPNGVVEFDLRGLDLEFERAVLTVAFERFHNADARQDEGMVPLRLKHAQGDGVVDGDDHDPYTWREPFISFMIAEPITPLALDVTDWVLRALEGGWSHISFRIGVWNDRDLFSLSNVYAAAYRREGEGSLEKRFALEIVPVLCEDELAETRLSLESAVRDLAVATADTDEDGVRDTADECPDTFVGAEVDLVGCSQVQFCSGIDATTGQGIAICNTGDWKGDEPLAGNPGDCMAHQGLCSAVTEG